MAYEIIPNSDTHNLERKSSISQHGSLLFVYRLGEKTPLVSDYIDGIKCGKVYSHKVAITDKPGLGYAFPVGTCRYLSELYLTGDQDEVVKKKLPEWFGPGFYDEHVKRKVFLNDSYNALGVVNEHIHRVGKDYVVAKDLLKAAD